MAISGAAGEFLNAVFSGRGKLNRREAAAEVTWTPNGDMPPTTRRPLKPLKPEMNGRLPKGMAELLVYPAGDSESFGLLGAYGDELAEPLGEAGRPGLDLNSLVLQLEQPINVVMQMASWSREKRKLVDWLNQSRADAERNSTEFELVIWDDTGFRIPWELFWLRDPETLRPPDFLGALMTVTRWLTVTTSSIVQDFTKNLGHASGPVAAYIHEDPEPDRSGPEPDRSMARDRELLQDFQVDYADSMWDLLTSLLDPEEAALAMVYAACHGEFSDRPGESALGGLLLDSANMLSDRGFRRLHNRQTLVFLNACSSGPLGEDRKRYNDGALRGFPKMFLETGAAGVLATAAPVESDLAHQVARDLFERLRLEPGLPIARAVRDLRRRAVDSLPVDIWRTGLPARDQQAANERLQLVLNRFLYLYYGSPRMAISFARSFPASDLPA